MSKYKICIDRVPNPRDEENLFYRAGYIEDKAWSRKRKYLVCQFLEGVAWKRAWVEKVVTEKLNSIIKLRFIFDQFHPSPHITICFQPKGAWSYVGTDCIKYSPPSMNLEWLDPPGEDDEEGKFTFKGVKYTVPANADRNKNNIGGTVIHEFCHALGLIHEHQNPRDNPIKWNVDKVYNFYSGPPNNWPKSRIRTNIINKYSTNHINGSEYDPDSIMLYYFPSELTENNFQMNANFELSKNDIQVLQELYGKPDPTVERSLTLDEEYNELQKEKKGVDYNEKIKNDMKQYNYNLIIMICLIIFFLFITVKTALL